ncbi:hypothetical protein A6V39_01280 [Candidatus Mycoplasma haematobovis]|uniref:Uncharacterized protein n=1 Tax=Candidatus Mycoplasma haematobovis TaxID=432608 RepID=A0A1A9QFG4_9MOLU|nr:hypothetical protein [Candidatus Mycoplasma haematobovis]OAL10686.1 hypothetical protein A6V39_01280 [Candidatus Mycoplasma haematobovis]
MTLPVKAGLGVLAAGSVAGLGYAGNAYFMNKEETTPKAEESSDTEQQGTAISELITKEYKYILLNTSANDDNTDNEHWKANWEKYKSANSQKETGKDTFKLTSWTKGKQEDLTAELKAKCSSLSGSLVNGRDNDDYRNVANYCGRSVTVYDEAKKNNLEIIDTEKSVIDATWSKKNTNKEKLRTHLEKLEITYDNIDETKIKDGCKKSQTKDKQLTDYQAYYTAYTKVCTKQPEDEQT